MKLKEIQFEDLPPASASPVCPGFPLGAGRARALGEMIDRSAVGGRVAAR